MNKLKYKFSDLRWYIDTTFSYKSRNQIIWLVILFISVFLFFLVLSFVFTDKQFEEGNSPAMSRTIRIVTLLINPGAISEVNQSLRIFAIIVAIVGILVLSGILITVLSNMLTRHIERFKNGDIRYKLKEHTIILGYNDLTRAFINRNKLDLKKILLVSEDSPKLIHEQIINNINKVILYKLQLLESVDYLNIENAKRIYIFGDNASNDDTLKFKLLEKICSKKINRESKIHCYIYLYNLDHSLISKKNFPNEWQNSFTIHLINIPIFWAEEMFLKRYLSLANGHMHILNQYWDVKRNQKRNQIQNQIHVDKNHIEQVINNSTSLLKGLESIYLFNLQRNHKVKRYVIIGLNTWSKAFIEVIMRMSHYIYNNNNEIGLGKTIITVVDTNMQSKMEEFVCMHHIFFDYQKYQYFDSMPDNFNYTYYQNTDSALNTFFEFVNGSPYSMIVKKLFTSFDDNSVIIVCNQDDNDNMQTACYFNSISTNNIYFIKQENSLWNNLIDKDYFKEKSFNFFGNKKSDFFNKFDDEPDIYATYNGIFKTNIGFTTNKNIISMLKEKTIVTGDYYYTKLFYDIVLTPLIINFKIQDKPSKELKSFIDNNRELLKEMEYIRCEITRMYCTHNLYATENKTIAYSQLNDDEKKKFDYIIELLKETCRLIDIKPWGDESRFARSFKESFLK